MSGGRLNWACTLSPDLGSILLLTTAPCWNHGGEYSATERRGLRGNLSLGKEKNREDGKF